LGGLAGVRKVSEASSPHEGVLLPGRFYQSFPEPILRILNLRVLGLPDGLFSNQKSQFWIKFEGLRLENVDIFYGHLDYFYGHLGYCITI
jgi:hypothetical protein